MTEQTRSPGCTFLVAEKVLPFVSLVGGWAGLDRASTGDYMGAGRKMAVLFASIWTVNEYGEHHVITFLVFWLFFYGWISDVVWARRDYRTDHGIPTQSPSWIKALILALLVGLSGIDRFYVNDRLMGALKLSLLVMMSSKPNLIPQELYPTIESLMYCWFACDLVLSPIRARIQ